MEITIVHILWYFGIGLVFGLVLVTILRNEGDYFERSVALIGFTVAWGFLVLAAVCLGIPYLILKALDWVLDRIRELRS